MNTLRELQSISDDDFENLVTWYLRRHDASLAGLLATGINEDGKPVSCPVDGVLYIPGDPPRCVAVASTTYLRSRLREKWLGNSQDKGDIQKAADEFSEWHESEPEIICTLYLATNRLLIKSKRALPLYRDAVKAGNAYDIGIEVIEASLLQDFLDHDREGQYLRQELLGIPTNRLGESLLRRIARQSLGCHRATFAMPQTYSTQDIQRDVYSRVSALVADSSSALIGLVGASGTGKSTLLRQLGESANAERGVALWVPAEAIQSATSIDGLLLGVLRRFHSSINDDAGEEALRLASSIPGGLVLLVDDINRADQPRRCLKTIEAWVRLETGDADSSERGRTPLVRFFVPLWPRYCANEVDLVARRISPWQYIELRPYSSSEKNEIAECLSSRFGHAAPKLVEALGGDPFLCGLLSAYSGVPYDGRHSLVRMIFEKAREQAAAAAEEAGQVSATGTEFLAALDELIDLVVRTGKPTPKWNLVRQTLGDRKADLLHVLASTNQIGYIDNSQGRDVWQWKHDRMRDALIGRWLADTTAQEIRAGAISGESRQWMMDPGLAECWAMALIFLPGREVQSMALALLSEYQPLALCEALRLNLFPDEEDLRKTIAAGIKGHLQGFDERSREFAPSPQRWVLAKLAESNDPLVLDITDGLQQGWQVWAARTRNGDIDAALQWIVHELPRGQFLPGVTFPLLEQALQSLSGRSHEREKHLKHLQLALADPRVREAAIVLAGYLAWTALEETIADLWRHLPVSERTSLVTPFAWAFSRFGTDRSQIQLEEVLMTVGEISDERRDEGGLPSDRFNQFAHPLDFSLRRWPITPSAAEVWARVGARPSDLQSSICYVLRSIDYPATLETYIRWSASQGGTLWDDAGEAVDPMSEYTFSLTIPRESSTRAHLWHLFETETDTTLRGTTLIFWARSASPSDLQQLRDVGTEDPLSDTVLRLRLRLRDKTAAPLLIEKMNEKPEEWCRFAPLLYDEPGVDEALQKLFPVALQASEWWCHFVPQHLPADAVTRLIAEHSELLSARPIVWPALWHSDVPDALSFVREAIEHASAQDLEHFFSSSDHAPRFSVRMMCFRPANRGGWQTQPSEQDSSNG